MVELELIDGAGVLLYAGVTGSRPATPAEVTRAANVAAAINAGISHRLEWPDDRVATPAELAELKVAAELAAAELWRRRDAPFGVAQQADATGVAFRVARDYLTSVEPIVDRHREKGAGGIG